MKDFRVWLNEGSNEKGLLFKKRTSSISNISVIAGVVIIIVFSIVYRFFI
ncbi:hypothetical protein [Alkaliphilus hydrothermalis]|uniref:Uncharacterized protein n=1 Tax=Alkaliphilus hydrothermalis TaxID=1482730 RepID=A0ABS2NLQ3_9FIRM|nr:hypothetical protein [Alkaliphilus hydrothermalis]MBM7613863.1 hypothetical protein [Alkaliphilus hydrothermalis]